MGEGGEVVEALDLLEGDIFYAFARLYFVPSVVFRLGAESEKKGDREDQGEEFLERLVHSARPVEVCRGILLKKRLLPR